MAKVFNVGQEIQVRGLTSKAGQRYNNWTGEITKGPGETTGGRYGVKFLNGATKSFKPENLRRLSNVIFCHNSKRYDEFKHSGLVAMFVNSDNSDCRSVKKDVDRLSLKFKKLVFIKVDCDEMQDIAAQEQVEEIYPVFVFYLGGSRKEDMKVVGIDLQELETNCEKLSEEAANFIEVGTRVEIHGLQSAAGQKVNGSKGSIVQGPLPSGRYSVQIDGENTPKALKPDNLNILTDEEDLDEEKKDVATETEEENNDVATETEEATN